MNDRPPRQARVSDAPETSKSSDQMPEEGPAEAVPDDVPGADEGAARETGRRHARRAAGNRERHAPKDGADDEHLSE